MPFCSIHFDFPRLSQQQEGNGFFDYIRENKNKSSHLIFFSKKSKILAEREIMSIQQNSGRAEGEWQRAMDQKEAAHRPSEFQQFLAAPSEAINNAQICFPPPCIDHCGYCFPASPANSLPNSRKSSADSTASTIPYQIGGSSNAQALTCSSTTMVPYFGYLDHQELVAMADSAEQQQIQTTMALANVGDEEELVVLSMHPVNEGGYGQMAALPKNAANVNLSPVDTSNWSKYVDPKYMAKNRTDLERPQQFQLCQTQFHQNHFAKTGLDMPLSAPTVLPVNQLCPGVDPDKKMAFSKPLASQGHSPPINSSPMDFLYGNGQNDLNGDKEIEKMLGEIRDFVKSPIMDFICEILIDENRKHICSFIGPREFHIHQPNTFARMLHLAKTPFKEEKSYLKIARAMKSFELRTKNGQVVMKKVPEKRNQYKFYPNLP